MKSPAHHACVFLTSAFLLGCGVSEYTLKPTGDMIKVTTAEKAEIAGELLAVRDSTILVLRDDTATKQPKLESKLLRLKTADLRKIEVNGYSDRSWAKYVLIFEGVPTVLITAAAASYYDDSSQAAPWFFAGALLTGLNYLLFELSTPSPPGAEQPFTNEKLNEMRKYARFPIDMTTSELDSLLTIYTSR
jgi:hypothetical protein